MKPHYSLPISDCATCYGHHDEASKKKKKLQTNKWKSNKPANKTITFCSLIHGTYDICAGRRHSVACQMNEDKGKCECSIVWFVFLPVHTYCVLVQIMTWHVRKSETLSVKPKYCKPTWFCKVFNFMNFKRTTFTQLYTLEMVDSTLVLVNILEWQHLVFGWQKWLHFVANFTVSEMLQYRVVLYFTRKWGTLF